MTDARFTYLVTTDELADLLVAAYTAGYRDRAWHRRLLGRNSIAKAIRPGLLRLRYREVPK